MNEKELVEKLRLTKGEREDCVPTKGELDAYLEMPDDEVALKLRKELEYSDFRKIGFIILYTEKLESAQLIKILTTPILIERGECDRIGGCMYKMFGSSNCKCNGTGLVSKTYTIKEAIEEKLK